MVRSISVLLVACLALAATVGSSSTGDAGTGGDAGNTAGAATPIAYGAYTATAQGSKDADWYALPGFTSPRCVESAASGTTWADNLLRTPIGEVSAPLAEVGKTRFGIIVESADKIVYAFTPAVNPTTNQPSRPGSYAFEVRAHRQTDLTADGGTGKDAGDDAAGSVALTRNCVAGALSGVLDSRDVYSLERRAGQILAISFTKIGDGGPAVLTLVAPDGTEVAELTRGFQRVTLPMDGAYYFAVTENGDISGILTSGAVATGVRMTSTSVPYMFAFADDPGSSCRPVCAS